MFEQSVKWIRAIFIGAAVPEPSIYARLGDGSGRRRRRFMINRPG